MKGRRLFENVTFTFNTHCRYGLTGPNGSGKSTLLKIIMGLEPQTTGTVTLPKKVGFLKQRIEEEVEGVRDVLGATTMLTGFYSYGEISPFTPNAKCELHNQTMTITTFSEA